MVYRFEVPAGAGAVSVAIEMENQFVVSATDQAPLTHRALPAVPRLPRGDRGTGELAAALR